MDIGTLVLCAAINVCSTVQGVDLGGVREMVMDIANPPPPIVYQGHDRLEEQRKAESESRRLPNGMFKPAKCN